MVIIQVYTDFGREKRCHRADTAVHITAAATTVHTAHRIIQAVIRAAAVIRATRAIRRAITARQSWPHAAITEAIRRLSTRLVLVLRSLTGGIRLRMEQSDIFTAPHMTMIIILRDGRQMMDVFLKKDITMRTVSIMTI